MKAKNIKEPILFFAYGIIFILVGFIIAQLYFQRYPDMLFRNKVPRNEILDVVKSYSVEGCVTRISPEVFKASNSLGFASASYRVRKGCNITDEPYAGSFYIIRQDFKDSFCEAK